MCLWPNKDKKISKLQKETFEANKDDDNAEEEDQRQAFYSILSNFSTATTCDLVPNPECLEIL